MTYSKRPVALHSRKANDLRVLLAHFLGSRTGHEVEVKDSADGVVLEVLFAISSPVNLDIHSIRIQEEHPMSTILSAVINVDRMSTVKVRVGGDAICVTVPDRASIVCGR